MNTDPRSALAALIAALERHYEAASASRGDDDPALDAATEQLTTAFDTYDDALFDAYDIATPLIVFDGEDDDDDDEDDFDDLDDFEDDEDDYDSDDDDDDDDDDDEYGGDDGR
ncbi:DNA primase [Brachybacterium fresconis]|uniref:ABC-type Zn2+ transport system substrate-binding protein/surface adhesin n=1 Tax=Brachybacterium fresconis TaxID=173363 RepID=A0ABS4YFJ0_9MICO|nr:DNA primase [Brachybacterium fresconis]MBP2407494.1 ABC-type Zn2+ transport system substrate-binding protein/surface adhesin [Brachybacterium fresconis]